MLPCVSPVLLAVLPLNVQFVKVAVMFAITAPPPRALEDDDAEFPVNAQLVKVSGPGGVRFVGESAAFPGA